MDKSMQNPLINKTPFSPRSRQNISTKRQTPLTPNAFKKSSRFSVSGRSTQSIQIIAKSPYNYVERFGQPLPVLITEALTYADRSILVSTRISEIGYAWLVCGRRLLIWQYRQSPSLVGTPLKRQTISNQCFELLLPQSDLAHRAELVSVFAANNSHIPSCIAVSPEGVVRYWPSVAHEGVSVEQIVDLQGQECDSLTDVGAMGCILATTTCTVVLVQPHVAAGRQSLTCHTLRTPSGWLGGISKRMSSLIFGPLSSEHSAETRLVRVLSVKQENENLYIVYVLAGHSLQKWQMSPNNQEQLIFVAELNRLVRDGFHYSVWESCGGDQTEMDTWLLDIQPDKDGVILLAAAVNMHVSPQVHYALICVQTNNLEKAPTQLRDFMILKLSGLYREDNPADSLNYRFLVSGTTAYLFNQRSITVVRPQEDPDALDFHAPGDLLLGGSICVNTPIFFSRVHGLVSISAMDSAQNDFNASITSHDLPVESSFNESAIASNLTLYNIDPDEMYNAYKDTIGQFKAAFIFHIKNQHAACQEILQQLLTSETSSVPGVDAFLDKVVLTIAENLLDDYPAGDPRWTKDNVSGIGSSFAMQILNQLLDKQKAFDLFINFLHQTDLWNRLAAVTVRDSPLFTVHALGELSEKIVAAIELKNATCTNILDSAIEKVVATDKLNYEYLLPQDIFYREVSKIQRVLQEITNSCDAIIRSDSSPEQIATYISQCNELLLSVLKEVIQHRQTKAEDFTVSINAISLVPDYLPWTSAAGPEGLNEALMLQQSLTCNYGARVVGDVTLRNTLYDQLVNLIDIILDGRKCHLESVKGTQREDVLLKQYETDRKRLIKSLVTDKEWERAALLAEKYLDLESLVIICESTDNQQRLDEYMDRFSNEGFSEFVYSWYLQENKQGKLISRCKTTVKPKSAHTLNKFLADHPSLSWIQNMYDKKFASAAEILKKLAIEETESVTRQKTILSLAKLAKLSSSTLDVEATEEYINDLNTRLELIMFQEDIPDYVLQAFGYDTIRPRVISPPDLIELYICPEYTDSNEIDFKKALDLLVYVSDESVKNELSLKIWRRAILRDSWSEANLNSPLEALQNTLFFRIVDIAFNLGTDPQEILPPLELLIADEEMLSLQQNPNFQYLIKMGYEQVCNS